MIYKVKRWLSLCRSNYREVLRKFLRHHPSMFYILIWVVVSWSYKISSNLFVIFCNCLQLLYTTVKNKKLPWKRNWCYISKYLTFLQSIARNILRISVVGSSSLQDDLFFSCLFILSLTQALLIPFIVSQTRTSLHLFNVKKCHHKGKIHLQSFKRW